tara:strand:- start:169 stop:678 length:510 start_codon:yes stop_codon:yes gene_type:complete
MTPNAARQILGVSSTATQDEIKQAWKDLAFSFHPDRTGVGNEARRKRLEEKLKEVNVAYGILKSVQRVKKPTKRQNTSPKRPQPTDDWRAFATEITKEGLKKLRNEAVKKYNKEYNEKNKEKLKVLRKEYQEKSKEKLKEIQKEWKEKNKKRLKEYKKELKKKAKQTFP